MVALNDIFRQKAEILRLASHHGAHHVRVFGSVARNATTPSSDLDLLVQMDEERSLIDRIALKHALEDLLGCTVDVVNERALHPRVRARVSDEWVEL